MDTQPRARPKKSPVLVIVVVVLGLLLLSCLGGLVLLVPALGKARDAARDTVALTNQRQVIMGLVVYAMDHDERLPDPDQWVLVATQQAGNAGAALLNSPRIDGGGVEYLYAPPRLADGSIAQMRDIDNPSAWIILYEDPSLLPARYDSVIAGYLDGHVQMVTRDALSQALKLQEVPIVPHASRKPETKPAVGPG